jgi:hypothetical protein
MALEGEKISKDLGNHPVYYPRDNSKVRPSEDLWVRSHSSPAVRYILKYLPSSATCLCDLWHLLICE